MSGVFFSHSLPPFMNQGLSLNLGLTDATRLVVKQTPELPLSPHLCLPSPGLQTQAIVGAVDGH